MEIDLTRFRETFFQEADEHLVEMESGLLQLENDTDPELLNAIFRGAHSIKGASGTFGFDGVMRFTHVMESLLDRMRDGQVAASRERVDLLLKSLDVLRKLLEVARKGTGAPPETDRIMQQLLAAQRAGDFSPEKAVKARTVEVQATWSIRFQPSLETFRQGMDPVLVLRELARLGEVSRIDPDVSRLPSLASLVPDVCYLGWRVQLKAEVIEQDIRDVFAFVEDNATIEIRRDSPGKTAPVSGVSGDPIRTATHTDLGTIRVATGKVDKLIDLVGELIIAQSMASQTLTAFQASDLCRLQETFAEVERYTRELQDRLMGIRMLPVGSVFTRLPRLVRDLSATIGKEISLEIVGEDTELDKSVVERLGDPLMHLVRNAVDHGIESPADRMAAGKSAAGTIRLHARHQGGSVVLDVSDDGRGLDRDRIFAKAVERGIRIDSESPSDEQIFNLIFEPGFSTATTVTDISGRGVGLDVVKRSVDGLNGSILILSERGQGVTFRIKLPLTLAILDGLLLGVADQRYVLPLISIMESIAPRREQLRNIAGKGEVIVLRGEPLPLVRLKQMFHTGTKVAESHNELAVIVEHRGNRLALMVDELLGQQQVVIKSLETNFRKVEGTLGATILGDGQPALILDVASIAEMAKGMDRKPAAA